MGLALTDLEQSVDIACDIAKAENNTVTNRLAMLHVDIHQKAEEVRTIAFRLLSTFFPSALDVPYHFRNRYTLTKFVQDFFLWSGFFAAGVTVGVLL